MMKATDRILGPARGSKEQALLFSGINNPATGTYIPREMAVQEYIFEVYRLAPLVGIDPAIVVAQGAEETDNWRSAPWRNWLNPAGLGITYKGQDPGYRWKDGADAARAQIVHLYTYAMAGNGATAEQQKRFAEHIEPYLNLDPRWTNVIDAGWGGTVRTVADLSGKWATDPKYAEKIAAKGNAIFGDSLPDQEGTDVTEYRTVVPGLPGGPLVTDYPIHLNLIPKSSTRQRPGIAARTPRRSVQHGTDNPNNPDAMAEAQYFVNGAEGRQASVHYCTDDTKAVVVVPLDEVTWQAADGAGPGNMNGFSCEMMEATAIWWDPARRTRLIEIAADLMGRTAARLGAWKPERHWDFNAGSANRHHCPNLLMNTGLWDSAYVPLWNAARTNELTRMGGGTTTTTTTAPPVVYPATPIPAPDAISAQGHPLTVNDPDRFECIQGGHLKTAPSMDAPNIDKPAYKAGRRYTFAYRTPVNGEDWLVSKTGSWAPAKNFEQ